MIAPLTPAERLVLEALCEEGTRWHHLERLSEHTQLTLRATRSTLADLRRRDLVVKRAQLGPGSAEWSVTTIGADLFAHHQTKAAPRCLNSRGHDTEGAPLPCPTNV